jgi:hypothetical protein
MDVAKILADLRQEREQLEEAILSLERLALGRGPRRGRPPSWMSQIKMAQIKHSEPTMTGVKRRGRPPGSKNRVPSVVKVQLPPQEKTVTASA